jgi:hypothetical protein
MSKASTQGGKNGGNSSLQEAKGAGNSGTSKGNQQSADAGGKAASSTPAKKASPEKSK